LPRDLDDNAKLEEAPAGAIDASFRRKEAQSSRKKDVFVQKRAKFSL